MNSILITIDKNIVLSDVYKYTGLTGQKSGDIDKVSATEDDKSIVRFLEEVGSELESILGEYYISTDESKEAIKYSLMMPSNWNEAIKGSMVKTMHQFLSNSVLLKWFKQTKETDVKYYSDVISDISIRIKKNLCSRIKPTR